MAAHRREARHPAAVRPAPERLGGHAEQPARLSQREPVGLLLSLVRVVRRRPLETDQDWTNLTSHRLPAPRKMSLPLAGNAGDLRATEGNLERRPGDGTG